MSNQRRHPSRSTIQRFLRSELTDEARYRLVIHLASCSECRDLVETERGGLGWLERSDERASDNPSGSPFTEFFRKTLTVLDARSREIEAQRLAAPTMVEEILRHPATRWPLLVDNSRRFHTFGLAERLLVECRNRWDDDPELGERLARLALSVIDKLSVADGEEPLVNDLRGEAWSFIANCSRLQSNNSEVEPAFDEAEFFLALGTGDAIERATLLDLRAVFLIEQSRADDALALLKEAASIYRRFGDQHLEGQIILRTAQVAADLGEMSEAAHLLRLGSQMIDPGREFGPNGTLRSQTASDSLVREVIAQLEVNRR